jgi:hypothetical protein
MEHSDWMAYLLKKLHDRVARYQRYGIAFVVVRVTRN